MQQPFNQVPVGTTGIKVTWANLNSANSATPYAMADIVPKQITTSVWSDSDRAFLLGACVKLMVGIEPGNEVQLNRPDGTKVIFNRSSQYSFSDSVLTIYPIIEGGVLDAFVTVSLLVSR